MKFEQLALIAAGPAFKNQLLETLAKVEADTGSRELLKSWNVFAFDSLSSTMDLADVLAESNFTETGFNDTIRRAWVNAPTDPAARFSGGAGTLMPAIIISTEQHRGRGRDGRTWHSTPAGGVYTTLVLQPEVPPKLLLGYSLGVGLAVSKFLESYGIVSRLKWPNDVLVTDPRQHELKKICGILIEMNGNGEQINSLSVGIGLNLNQPMFPQGVPGISVAQLLGERVDFFAAISLLVVRVIAMLDELKKHGFAPFAEEYNSRSLVNGAVVRVGNRDQESTARVLRVAPDGGLEVETAGGEKRVIYSGDLSLENYNAMR